MTEDTELLRRFAEEQSEAAFTELVHRRIGLVYSVGLRTTHDPQRAEDATQSVFVAPARKARSLSKHKVLVGWLHRTAHFTAIDIVRAEARRTAREREVHTRRELIDPEPDADWDAVRPVLDAALSEIDDRDREAVLLRFFDDRPYAEIAFRIGLTENAARMRVERALVRLRTALAKRGIDSTPAALLLALADRGLATPPVGLAETITTSAFKIAGTGATGGLVQWIGTAKMSVALSALAFVGATTLAGYEAFVWRAAVATGHAETPGNAAPTQRDDRALAQLRQSAARVTEAKRSLADFFALKQKAAKAAIPPNAIRMPDDAKDASRHRSLSLARDSYGALLPSLHLTAPQTDRFLDFTNGLNAARAPEFNVGIPPSIAEVETNLRRLLGEDRFALFQRYDGELPMRRLSRQLAGALYYTPAPLAAGQSDQLVQLYATVRSRETSDTTAWQKVTEAAASILTPAQVAALTSLRCEAAFEESLEEARKESVR